MKKRKARAPRLRPAPSRSKRLSVAELIHSTALRLKRAKLVFAHGTADPVAEAASVQHWLRNEHVHLAVDPEFTLGPNENPRDDIITGVVGPVIGTHAGPRVIGVTFQIVR